MGFGGIFFQLLEGRKSVELFLYAAVWPFRYNMAVVKWSTLHSQLQFSSKNKG